MTKDYYAILGCSRNSSSDEIKKQFKKMALQHHPDKNNGNDEKFKEINEAYSILNDTEKKAKYDNPNPFGGGHPFEEMFGNHFSFQFHQRQRHPQRQREKRQRKDIDLDVTISLEEAFFGFNKITSYTQPRDCECIHNCHDCNGIGKRIIVHQTGFMQQILEIDCDVCKCTGFTSSTNCTECSGIGRKEVKKDIRIASAPGVKHKAMMTVKGSGEQPHEKTGDIPGNLKVIINILPHVRFVRENDDLLYSTEIEWIDSICGTIINIPLFDDLAYQYNIGKFGQIYSDKIYTIVEKGFTSEDKKRGDLKIQFKIKEQVLNLEQKQKLRNFITSELFSSQIVDEDKEEKINTLSKL